MHLFQGLHPRLVSDGFEIGKQEAMKVLDSMKLPRPVDRDTLIAVARTSLRTKLPQRTADMLTEVSFASIDAETRNDTGVCCQFSC
jgi:T-complex protein 1 subunit zeta